MLTTLNCISFKCKQPFEAILNLKSDYGIIKGERVGCHIRTYFTTLMIILLLYVEAHIFI